MRTSRIAVEQAAPFRKQYLSPALVSDPWDERSLHYALLVRGDIAVDARVTHAWNGQLPFLDYVDLDADLASSSVEIGRVLAAPQFRKSGLLGLLCRDLLLDLHSELDACDVYVDSIVQPDLTHKTLIGYGFMWTGAEYFDERYEALSLVFSAPLRTLLTTIQERATPVKT